MRRSWLWLAVAATMMGCFKLQPVVGAAPETGTRVAIYLNDAGRAALSSSVGLAIERIEGTLSEQDLEGFSVSVLHVYFLQGGVQIWAGERVRVAKEQVQYLAIRRLAAGRTVALGAVGVGGVAFMLSRGLLGFGLGDDPTTPTDSGEQLRLIWP